MRLFQRITHAVRIQIIVIPNFQHHQHLHIVFFVHFARVYVQVPLLAGRCPDAMSLRTNQTFTFAALPLLAASAVSSYPVPKNGTRFLFTMNSSLLKNCQRWKAAQEFLFCQHRVVSIPPSGTFVKNFLKQNIYFENFATSAISNFRFLLFSFLQLLTALELHDII